MAHYARVNENGIVVDIQVVKSEVVYSDDPSVRESLGAKEEWIKTSYNTRGGKHYKPDAEGKLSYIEEDDSKPALRYNFAEVGGHYDKENDAFYAPQPFPSWLLDRGFEWQAPVAMPTGENPNFQVNWNEELGDWELDKINGPHESWLWDDEEETFVAPKAKPVDGKSYRWNEEELDWELKKEE